VILRCQQIIETSFGGDNGGHLIKELKISGFEVRFDQLFDGIEGVATLEVKVLTHFGDERGWDVVAGTQWDTGDGVVVEWG
jgi:hypothetical protein|tara:strand:+ start:1120 stop:1362 length:243 start_codon:yes stop_codon:yes gene_type:complete